MRCPWFSAMLAVWFLAGLLQISEAEAQVRFDAEGQAITPTTRSDWFSHPMDEKYYTESWTTMVAGDKGHIFYITFLRSNIGVFKGSAGLTVSATLPGEKARIFDLKYSLKDFSEDKKTGRITIKENYIEKKGKKVVIHIREKDLEADLEIHSFMDGVKFRGGRFFLDKSHAKSVATFVHVPWGSVKGTVKVGDHESALKGHAFTDHLVQNVLGTDYSTHWWVMRFFHKEYTIAFFVFKSPKALQSKIISRVLVVDRKQVVEQSNVMSFEPDKFVTDPKGHRYATRYAFEFQGEKIQVKGTATQKTLHDRDAMLERLSAIERGVVELVAGKPINYRQVGHAEISLTVTGGEEQTLKGKAYMETIVLVGE